MDRWFIILMEGFASIVVGCFVLFVVGGAMMAFEKAKREVERENKEKTKCQKTP